MWPIRCTRALKELQLLLLYQVPRWFVPKGTITFFLNTGRMSSYSSNFAIILVNLFNPPEKKFLGKLPSVLFCSFSASASKFSIFWQYEFTGKFQSWNCVIQSVPNRLLVFFRTNNFNLIVFPLNNVLKINSPLNLIFPLSMILLSC